MLSNKDGRPATLMRAVRLPVSLPMWTGALLAGFGGFLTVLLLGQATAATGALLLIAPFGASCVLVFALPRSPLAQPRNVVGGHLVSTLIGLLVLSVLGSSPFAMAVGVGLAITAMQVTGTTHPPAGADPIVVILAQAGWSFLLTPVLAGALAIVLMGIAYRRFMAGLRPGGEA